MSNLISDSRLDQLSVLLGSGYMVLLTLYHSELTTPIKVVAAKTQIVSRQALFVPINFSFNVDNRFIKININDSVMRKLLKRYNKFSVVMEFAEPQNANMVVDFQKFDDILISVN